MILSKSDLSKYDILSIDMQILKKLNNNIREIKTTESDLSRLLWISEFGVTQKDKNIALNEASFLKKKIQDVKQGFELLFYLTKTKEIIEEYKKLNKDLRPVSFVKTAVVDQTKLQKRNELIFIFLMFSKDYIDIENITLKHIDKICENCSCIDFSSTSDSSIFICKNCNVYLELLDDSPSYKDFERIKIISKNSNISKEHFSKAIDNYECKQTKIIPQELLDNIRSEMKSKKFTVETVTKNHVYSLLSKINYKDYYENINLIYFKITGKKPEDISHLRLELLEMNEEIDNAYEELGYKENSHQNVIFKLYKHLQLLDIPCNREDFFFLKDHSIEKKYYEIWALQIDYLKQKYPDALNSKGKKKWRYIAY